MLRGAIWPYPTPSRDVREVYKVYYSSYYQIEYSVKDTDMKKVIVVIRIAFQLALPVGTLERAFVQVKEVEMEEIVHEVKRDV